LYRENFKGGIKQKKFLKEVHVAVLKLNMQGQCGEIHLIQLNDDEIKKFSFLSSKKLNLWSEIIANQENRIIKLEDLNARLVLFGLCFSNKDSIQNFVSKLVVTLDGEHVSCQASKIVVKYTEKTIRSSENGNNQFFVFIDNWASGIHEYQTEMAGIFLEEKLEFVFQEIAPWGFMLKDIEYDRDAYVELKGTDLFDLNMLLKGA
jgi:hypothetical protein